MREEPLVRVLGAITVRRPCGEPVSPARLDRTVLAHLVLADGRAVPAADLLEAVWGPDAPAGARNALQVKISRLRRHLGPYGGALQHRQGGYRLVLPDEEVDLRQVADLTNLAAEALAAGRPDDAAATATRALALWEGDPFADLDEHPRLVAARTSVTEQRAALVEMLAEADLATGRDRRAVTVLRELLAEMPLRPRARLLLMRALDRAGRRAEALAVYDVGRRVLAEQTGLAPPEELQEAFEELLGAERAAAGDERPQVPAEAVPLGAMETARWLARDGATGAAIELALRGSWWWWLGGRRSQGRELLEELIGAAGIDGDRPAVLGATAWLAVFDAVTADSRAAIAAGEDALRDALGLGWGRHESLAAVLLAERLFQRGEPRRGTFLLRASRAHFDLAQDRWGLALVGLTEAKADLQRGAVTRAVAGGEAARRVFEEIDDAAGQMMAMDLLGYCAEIVGDLAGAALTHERALAFARAVEAPDWQATQLTRLGSVQALRGAEQSVTTLRAAVQLARSIGSAAGLTLAENALGLARGLAGEHDRAAEVHATALEWYERQQSPAGVSYTAGRLALELAATAATAVGNAARLAERSVELARRTGDPRAVAHGLEAVALTHHDAPTRARALGEAWALRRRTRSPLPPVMAGAVRAVHQDLRDELGTDLLGHLRAGGRAARMPEACAATS